MVECSYTVMKETSTNNFVSVLRSGLNSSPWYKLFEIMLVFISAFAVIKLLIPFAGDDPILKQAVIWLANIVMLIVVYAGLKLRGESLKHFGLTFGKFTFRDLIRVLLLSLLVFVIAVIGFLLGSFIIANITGIPETSDLSAYGYLKGNLGMLVLTLAGVYIVSSFGEEVIYRAFLINRISEFNLSPKLGVALALVISSLIFGLAHYEWGLMGIAQTALMGLALGICYIKLKKKLWALVLAHAYMDTILMVQMYLASN